jgi:hypothetical protein
MRHHHDYERDPLLPEKAHIALPTAAGFNVQLDSVRIELQTMLKVE